ncbi:hypothetical protein CIK86_15165 [Pseudoalteromonas sp. JB197]|nr:hypothetical protein CIK86_15165 [Pseudoalteromonas sp. JB197]SJN36379.1 hypothetical protein CZ797_08315 [Pseudoalteromonas sp. JB197]
MVIEAFEAGYVMKLKIIKVEGQNESLPIVVDESGLPIDKLNFFIIGVCQTSCRDHYVMHSQP